MVVLSASFRAIPNVVLVYSSKFCQMICYAFIASHLVLVKVRSILSIQMVHMVLPLNISQTLKVLLGEVGIFLPSIMCCQWRGLHGPFCLGFAFMMLMTPMEEVSCSPCNPTILLFKNLCAIFSGGTTHAQVTFIINVYNNSCSACIICNGFMPNWLNKGSFLLAPHSVPRITPFRIWA